jgi:probable F420-dependent oxidoreductase
MLMRRPFRFATGPFATASGAEYLEAARRIEALGYAIFLTGDHFRPRWFEPGPACTAAALATSSLRVGCTVFCNDFRHPALLAKEAASIDVLTGGRFEFGIGAGWLKAEYDELAIPFDPPGVRVSRLEEAVQIVKGLWHGGPFTFSGQYYQINDLEGTPRPAQHPHPPTFIGGGGKRLLSIAGREADIVGINPRAKPEGGVSMEGWDEPTMAQRISWVKEAAGDRFDRLELAILIQAVAVVDGRTARDAAAVRLATDAELTPEQVLSSPHFLIGSVDNIEEDLIALRERHGVSHISIFGRDMESFAPVVARLAGR